MSWAIHHKWPISMQFIFNCYCNWATLVVCNTEGSGHFLHSKEGGTQGDNLDINAYGIGVLPLIRELQDIHPRVTQPWYYDDAEIGGQFQRHTDPPPGPPGEGDTVELLTGTDQEHIGRSPAEHWQIRSLLLRHGTEGGHRKPLPWGLHW